MTLQERVERLFVERREEIYVYLVSLGVRPEEAQEMTQESFMKYFVALGEGQSIANPRAWVYAVAHNLAVNSLARGEVLAVPMATEETPESLILEPERMAALRNAISSLSPQQQSCLHSRADGFRYKEIAAILGISPSTVGEFLQRAVKRLRKAIYE